MSKNSSVNTVSRQRRTGVLLHPTSLPGELSNGDIGHEAYRFIEFLHSHGFKVWQMLPLGTTHDDKSPYQCLSSHAGNPLLISLDWLEDKGWLDKNKIEISKSEDNYRISSLQIAAEYFYKLDNKYWAEKIEEFKKQNTYWLDDYSLFIALKTKYQNKPWFEWPEALRHREEEALDAARLELQSHIQQAIFEQFIFFTQWQEVRDYAKQHKVELFGDMPIFVARDSADVWAQRDNFLIDKNGVMKVIAGVPPDAFSDTGQRWGNPLFDWEHMQSTNFDWWKSRFHTQLALFDIVRIDHFRGLHACWVIPEEDDTAINGTWVEVPGRELLKELFETFDYLPLIAEDLGVITDEVIELKTHFNLPGMKVLQFAFDGNNNNPHLPHHHRFDDVIYTGTHDNDTTLGWLNAGNNHNRHLEEYIDISVKSAEEGALSMVRLALSSVSFLCILPMQDLLMQDSSSRMNIPGTVSGNWKWRFEWQEIKPVFVEKITHFMNLYQR